MPDLLVSTERRCAPPDQDNSTVTYEDAQGEGRSSSRVCGPSRLYNQRPPSLASFFPRAGNRCFFASRLFLRFRICCSSFFTTLSIAV